MDADGDGWEDGEDCDDGNAEVRPDASEVCDNLVDDNCDERTDEDCETRTDVADPGGFAWVCGVTPEATWAWLLVAVVLGRRR